MTPASEVLQDFLGTVSIIALVAVVYGMVLRFLRLSGFGQAMLGLAFGAASIEAMFDPVMVAAGVIVDMRNVPVALAGAFLGPAGALIATLLPVAMRCWIGGAGVPGGVAGLVLSALAGLLWSRWTVRAGRRDALALAGLVALFPVHWVGLVLLPAEVAWKLLTSVLPVVVPLEMLALLAVGVLLERERRLDAERRHLAQAANSDPLTGLLNRRGFERAVSGRLQGRGGALLLLDLDHFKRINDAQGHPAGDAVLRALAARLARVLGPDDLLARFGGEELAVFLPGQSPSTAGDMARRLCEATRVEPFASPQGGCVAVTASIGGAWSYGGAGLDSLFLRADSALYAAKHAGRDRCCFAPEGEGPAPDAPMTRAASSDDPPPDARDGRLAGASSGQSDPWRDAAA